MDGHSFLFLNRSYSRRTGFAAGIFYTAFCFRRRSLFGGARNKIMIDFTAGYWYNKIMKRAHRRRARLLFDPIKNRR